MAVKTFKRNGIFSSKSNHKHRCFLDYSELSPLIERCRNDNLRIVLTQGTFDVVVLKAIHHPKWTLIRLIRPDVLIATKETYNQEQIRELKEFCGKIVVLEPMATTSTSAKIRKLQLGLATKLEQSLTPRLLKTIEEIFEEFKK